MVIHPVDPALKRFKHEYHEFEASLSCIVSTRPDRAHSKTVSKAERRKKRWRLQKPNLRGVSRTTKCTWRVMAGDWDQEGKLTGKRDRYGQVRMEREPVE